MSLTIRPMAPTDRDTALELLAAQLEEHDIATPREHMGAMLDGILTRPGLGEVLLAYLEAEPVGVAYLAYIWTLEHGGRVVWLEELFVRPAYRERGVGQKLLNAVLEHARRVGCVAIDLEVERSHGRAANLYARAGFRMLDRTRWTQILELEAEAGGEDEAQRR